MKLIYEKDSFGNDILKKSLPKKNQIYCNYLVIDNFYNNPIETRNYILTQEFAVSGNYPGQRTKSYANQEYFFIYLYYCKQLLMYIENTAFLILMHRI